MKKEVFENNVKYYTKLYNADKEEIEKRYKDYLSLIKDGNIRGVSLEGFMDYHFGDVQPIQSLSDFIDN